MDAANMEFLPSDCFDVIVDKALLDTVLCGGDQYQKCSMMLAEMQRVLKPGGVYVVVSFGAPSMRLPYLEGLDWEVECKELSKPPVAASYIRDPGESPSHYMYVCRKAQTF